MKISDIKTGMICEGDYVLDPMDGDQPREIGNFTIHSKTAATIHFSDGGCMGIDEVSSDMIRLESEING